MKGMIKLLIIWILAVIFTLNSLGITIRANFNMGTVMMWIISISLILYGIFHRHIDTFCAAGIGRVLQYLVIFGLTVFVGLFLFVAFSGYSDNADGNEKAIIVLGAGLRGEKIGDVLHRRLSAGLAAWQENPEAFIVVTGGMGPQESIPEALAMQRWLLEQGVPQHLIILEDKSTSTEENLTFAKSLLEEAGISSDQPVAIVTNAFHCYRASQYAQKLGFSDVSTVPASMNITTVLPSYMREVLAVMYMWVFRRTL